MKKIDYLFFTLLVVLLFPIYYLIQIEKKIQTYNQNFFYYIKYIDEDYKYINIVDKIFKNSGKLSIEEIINEYNQSIHKEAFALCKDYDISNMQIINISPDTYTIENIVILEDSEIDNLIKCKNIIYNYINLANLELKDALILNFNLVMHDKIIDQALIKTKTNPYTEILNSYKNQIQVKKEIIFTEEKNVYDENFKNGIKIKKLTTKKQNIIFSIKSFFIFLEILILLIMLRRNFKFLILEKKVSNFFKY
jgi:hypothetical protein